MKSSILLGDVTTAACPPAFTQATARSKNFGANVRHTGRAKRVMADGGTGPV
jgi:hypothetical protein